MVIDRGPGDLEADDEFPLGDGTASDGALVHCPWCGEVNEIALDSGGGVEQDYVEDCQVCCRPWRVRVHYGADGDADVSLTALE